ncbi:DUF6287 domain-containing protein [Streptococcus marmotae]|uniref:DUF6287 domain-containing protein n=1 Tax=Streptococcus marmotae TaxID=1825069 RepID=UPI00082ACCAE|nr:DUF6287 domain-containing protein [Streptococcus marmotae]
MKKTILGIVVLLCLTACQQTATPKETAQSVESTNQQTTTTETSASSSTAAPAQKKVVSPMDVAAVVAGDYSSVQGLWQTSKGETLYFDATRGLVNLPIRQETLQLHENGTAGGQLPYAAISFIPTGIDLTNQFFQDESDQTKDRIRAGQSPDLAADSFYYRVDEESMQTMTSVTDAESQEFPGYTEKQVEAARIYNMLGNWSAPNLIATPEMPAGTKVCLYSDFGKSYAKPTRMIAASPASTTITYTSNGDGTITVYPAPDKWHQSPEQLQDKEYMDSYTQKILDEAVLLKVPLGMPEKIQTILEKMEFQQ